VNSLKGGDKGDGKSQGEEHGFFFLSIFLWMVLFMPYSEKEKLMTWYEIDKMAEHLGLSVVRGDLDGCGSETSK